MIRGLNRYLLSKLRMPEDHLSMGAMRLKIIMNIVAIAFIIVVIRVGDLTMMQPSYDGGTDTRDVLPTDKDKHNRANIVDRSGVILATTLITPSLYADPTLIDNKPFIAHQLEQILGVENLLPKLERKGRFVWVERGVSPDQQKEINNLGTPGLAFKSEHRRVYPHGNLLSHLVGYTSVDGDGLAGIELLHDGRLKNIPDPLMLNVDVRIQYSLAKALQKQKDHFNAIAAMGGVIDVRTGEVIAAVSLPDFDPHHSGRATSNERFNRFASGVYEMGSTFKLFSTANYVEETGRPFSTTFDARKPLKEGRFTINDFHAEKRILTLPEVFIHSSNIGSALMGKKIGADAMQKFYSDLGLMDKIKADFPIVAKPLLPKKWRDINTLTASYGHGVAVSPLHLLQAASVIANGGIRTGLYFEHRDYPSDHILTRVVSPSTAYKMKQLLRLNVTHGSGAKADIDGYMVGGKTGTSEKVTANGYSKDKLLSSFIGVFPIDNPQYAVLAILDEPKGTKDSYGYATGGWTAAPVVGDVVRDMVRVLGMSPSQNNHSLVEGLERYIKTKDNKKLESF